MGTVKMHKGRPIVAYRDGEAIDFNGEVIPGAPKPARDADPSEQPGASGPQTSEDRLATALARALGSTPKPADTAEEEAEEDKEDEGLPAVSGLADHLAGISAVDEVKALRKSDKRKTAKPLYEARIAELEAK